LPPVAALLGKRKFYLIDQDIADAARLSPVAFLAPTGLEALSHFDMFSDITRICRSLQRATNAAFSGDFWTSSVTETRLKSQLRDMLALGTSNIAWGRRCEIMKCVCLAGLMYMQVVSRKEGDLMSAHRELSQLLPESDASWRVSSENLIGELICGDSGDCFESLAALMRIGTDLNQQSWYDIRRYLQDLYREVHNESLQAVDSDRKRDPQEMEMAGLTALFGFFSIAGG
jgi:hypothetical protein